jgi:hypothetical protein
MEALLAVLTGLLAGFVYIWKQNKKLETENRINKDRVEDAKLETIINELDKQRTDLSVKVQNMKASQSKPISDSQIVDFWNKRTRQ